MKLGFVHALSGMLKAVAFQLELRDLKGEDSRCVHLHVATARLSDATFFSRTEKSSKSKESSEAFPRIS